MPIIAAVQGYDLNIEVGQAQAIDVAGDRVQFLTATDPFAVIEVRPNFAQGNIVLKPGQGYRFAEQVTRWIVYNRGGVKLTGNLLIGTGDFFDQRISGDVNVIDGGKSRTLAKQAFIGKGYQALVAAQYAMVQLWNPAGSAKNVILESMLVGSATTQGINIMRATGVVGAGNGSIGAKMLGEAVGSAQIVTGTNAAIIGDGEIGGLFVQQGASMPYTLREPIILAPGNGLHIKASTLGTDVMTMFEWYEEAA
ncbi:conserved hypothetical protein [Cupriavidus taiwanensis]|uniref:hypothetical protein n=1 Tax=Cupriavidus taiwanensis TaxID=164546 RepID=UPI000E13C90F|nr:hypothetical protein [Cupriavidus taiwanensis]SOZ07292.1 conserved hypothetical protein [Cupriavidus taiwanensis]